ncbi:hypothetical protein KUTeg_013995 [Tegillarca granosa]|uniref:Expansin-like EG45 domain-containing protein n=1 Tax=Tegillarca granosa TaxID=220873 RepID=A0ABQ9EXS6_TEGGR|nr:hypothetical protein KUTeg_013995 [Tegillarca granosa]
MANHARQQHITQTDTKGACGCGYGDSPFPWMNHGFTTAPNSYFFDSNLKTWCGGNCGKCVKLTTTGGFIDGEGGYTAPGRSATFMVTNLCPINGNEHWCGQHSTSSGNTFGYAAHFDLEDTVRQVTNGLGWNNPEVTWEFVNCDAEHSHNHNTPSNHDYSKCQCHGHEGK